MEDRASRSLPLRRALLGNAAFSTASGLLMVGMPGVVASWLGQVAPWLLQLVGIGLLVFAADLVHQATRAHLSPIRALGSSVADFGWVVATPVLGWGAGDALSSSGIVLVTVVAVGVAGFGTAQLRGLRRLYTELRPDMGAYYVCLATEVDVAPAKVWASVRNVGRIVDYSPGLTRSFVRGDEPAAPGAVRECHDTGGQRWAEEVLVLDDEARRLELRFLAEEADFPFPMDVMFGGWQVESTATGSRVNVWWSVTPRQRWLALVLLPLMQARLAVGIADIVRRMAGVPGGAAPSSSRLAVAC